MDKFKKMVVLFISLSILCIFNGVAYSQNSCADYNYIPPTFVSQVPPTVMIALDVSGSMAWDTYIENFDEEKTYEGLFNPEKNYEKVNDIWEETTSSASSCPDANRLRESDGIKECKIGLLRYKSNADCLSNKVYSGSCLNYWVMTRIDVFRWAMTGGVPDGCTSSSKKCNPQQAFENETTGNIKTHTGEIIKIPLEGEHGVFDAVLYDLETKELRPRIGIMLYGGSKIKDSVYVGDFTQSVNVSQEYPYNNLITAINTADTSGGTPSGPAMWDVWNYYLQKSPEYGGLTPATGSDNSNQFKDPLWICENLDKGVECSYAPCSSNYVILASDGQWNTPSTYIDYNCSNPNSLSDTCKSPDPVVPAYKMHIGKTRDKDKANVKVDAVYSLGMFLGGTGEQALKNVAMYGGFDLNLTDSWPDSLSGFPLNSCKMDDGGNGKGSACTDLPASSNDWDIDADGVPDTFYSASNALELKNQLTAIFSDILSRVSSGSALGTVSTETRTSSMLFQAFYYPVLNNETGKEISWIGDLRSYFLDENFNIREDTDKNKTLNYGIDKILFFKFFDELSKTMAVKIDDSDADAIPDQCFLPSDGIDMLDINPILSVSDYLKGLETDNRVIMYNKNGSGDIENNFTTENVGDIKGYWEIADDNIASKLIKFIRGYDYPNDTNFRNRHFLSSNSNEIYKDVYKLGDIINSTPQILSNTAVNMYHFIYRDWSYYEYVQSETVQNREPVVFFGANDGMVHAVGIGKVKDLPLNEKPNVAKVEGNYIGKELWAFIPKNALPYLQWYNIESDSCHVPKVDYRFQLVDAKIGESDSWRTLLIGTMGFGGKSIQINTNTYSSSIFVIDVTDPLNAKFLWEMSLPDNTLTLSFPAVVKQNDSWFLGVGSGPINPAGSQFENKAEIFFYNLKTGQKVNSVEVPENKVAAVGDILSLDVDHDYNVDALVFGTYGAANSSVGNLYILNIRNGEDSYISVDSLAKGNISKLLNIDKPIFAATTDAFDEGNNLWLYGGTGRFLGQEDKTDSSTQMIFGIKVNDNVWKGISLKTITENDLFDSTDIEVTADIQEVSCYCLGVDLGLASFDFDTNSYSCSEYSSDCELVVTKTSNGITNYKDDNGMNLSVNLLGSYINNKYKGWKNYLDAGERSYSKQLLVGGLLDTLVFKPVMDYCSFGGTSYVIAVNYKTGTAAAQPSFLNSSGTKGVISEENKVVIVKKQSLGFGAPPIGKSITPMAPKEGEKKFTKLIQTSGGTVIKQEQQPDFSTSSKLIHMITR